MNLESVLSLTIFVMHFLKYIFLSDIVHALLFCCVVLCFVYTCCRSNGSTELMFYIIMRATLNNVDWIVLFIIVYCIVRHNISVRLWYIGFCKFISISILTDLNWALCGRLSTTTVFHRMLLYLCHLPLWILDYLYI